MINHLSLALWIAVNQTAVVTEAASLADTLRELT
jgi:hypothetical protein